ncbi:hypothetical protein INR49_003577 [Caranx melampygus]|nr:hypothetical protein INR49_003577 [Caranx melampygus]
MADTHVLPVSVTEQRRAAKKKKRARPPEHNPEEEEETRQKNMKRVSVLGEEDGSVKLLEELVFGAEDELLERLVEQVEEVEEVERTASLLVEEDEGEQSSESDDEAGRQRQASRRPAWVDEDDEQEEEVDMKHRYRKHLVRGDTEVTMTKVKLQQRMREQFQKAMGGAPSWAESQRYGQAVTP